MGLFRASPGRLWVIYVHEAGHVFVARHFGATDIRVSVARSGRAGDYSFTFDGSYEDEAVIHLAGLAAEILITGRSNGNCSYDLRQARTALRQTRTRLPQARKRAADLVRKHRADIETEARLLAAAAA